MLGKRDPVNCLFLTFVFLLPFQTLLPFRIADTQIQPADLAFVLVFTAWILALSTGRAAWRPGKFHLLLAAYLMAITLSTIASEDLAKSAGKLVGKIYLISIALISVEMIDTWGRLRMTIYAWLAGAGSVILLSLAGIIFFYMGFDDPEVNIVIHRIYGSLPSGAYPRLEGFFDYPSMFCNFLAVSWMFLIAGKYEQWFSSQVFWMSAGLLFLVNAFTLTPGLGGVFLATGIFLWAVSRARNPLIARTCILTAIIVAVLFFAAASVTLFSANPHGYSVPLAEGDVSMSHRAKAWVTGLETFGKFPLLGRGVGMPVSEAVFTDANGNNQLLTDPHNTYISVLAETGVVGFVSFFAIVGFVIAGSVRSAARAQSVAVCLTIAMIDAVLYQSLTGSYEDARHLWVVFGISAAVGRHVLTPDEKDGTSSQTSDQVVRRT